MERGTHDVASGSVMLYFGQTPDPSRAHKRSVGACGVDDALNGMASRGDNPHGGSCVCVVV